MLHRHQVRSIDDGATLAFGSDQLGPSQDAQVRRHGVLRHGKAAGYFSRGQTFRLMLHQQAKHVEAGLLRESCEPQNNLL